jgi:hypothetical protein
VVNGSAFLIGVHRNADRGGAGTQEDPLLEKGKGKFSRDEQRRKKQNNSWAGKSRD